MVKKRANKKLSKNKLISFSGLDFRKKILAVVFIVLVIGIVASVFPSDNVAGMATGGGSAFGGISDLLKGLLKGVNDLITTIFRQFFPGEDIKITYVRFVFFSLSVFIIFSIMKAIGSENPFINFIVGFAIAYLATMFIPLEIITTSGLLYSSTFMSLVLLVPFIGLWIVYFKMPKTKFGYILRCIFLTIMYFLIVGIKDTLSGLGFKFIGSIIYIMLIVIAGLFLYSIFRIFTVKEGEEAEEKAIDEGIPVLQGTIYNWIGKVAKKMQKKPPS